MSGNNTPLRFLGVGNMLDREYRNSPAYQWARELARNGIEADASRIRFGVEWRGVEATKTYRMQYADDGVGMTREDLRDYMLTLGKGSKAVGGPHDNYALGSRMTLLPWNHYGVVVISVHDGVANMVKMLFDESASDGNGEYVLAEESWEDENGEEGLSTVYPPYYDEDLELDWATTVPKFISDAGHGTTFVLLGDGPKDNTIDGDPDRNETNRYLVRKYFNVRFWDLPEGVTLQVFELPEDRANWPKAENEGHSQWRTVKGAKSIVEYIKADGTGSVSSSGVLTLPDGTRAKWWLRNEAVVNTGGVGLSSGMIAVLYRGELYGTAVANQVDGDTRVGTAAYRQFGIGNDDVRKRVVLILEPAEYNEFTGDSGVAPSTGRADLYWMGAGLSPRAVKPSDWSEQFADNMPEAIRDALRAAHEDSKLDSGEREERLRRVMARLTGRWRMPRAVVSDLPTAATTTEPTSTDLPPRAPIDSPNPKPPTKPGKPRKRRVGPRPTTRGTAPAGTPGTGSLVAKATNKSSGLPEYEFVGAADIADDGMMAAWQPESTFHPAGLIQIDKSHPVIQGQIAHWQKQYPAAVAPNIETIVLDAYADVAIAKVSHLRALTGTLISEETAEQMLQNPALTTALLGLIAEDAMITPRLGSLGTKKKTNVDDSDETEQEPDAPVDLVAAE